jgi:hypothetical protein
MNPIETFRNVFKRENSMAQLETVHNTCNATSSGVNLLSGRKVNGEQLTAFAAGDNEAARKTVLELAKAIGFDPVASLPFLPRKVARSRLLWVSFPTRFMQPCGAGQRKPIRN